MINLILIMAVPKRKTTVSKRNKRRSHHKISNMNVVEDKKLVNIEFLII